MLKNRKNKQTKKDYFLKQMGRQMDKRETNSDHDMGKKIFCKYSLLKECFKTFFIPWNLPEIMW